MLEIIFVCTGNICRSPMAEGLLRQKIKAAKMTERIAVSSAGLAALQGEAASANAQLVMQRRSIDVAAHRARQLTLANVDAADLVLTMTKLHKDSILKHDDNWADKVFTLKEYAGQSGDVEDPYGGSSAVYEICAAEIEVLLAACWEKIMLLAAGKITQQ